MKVRMTIEWKKNDGEEKIIGLLWDRIRRMEWKGTWVDYGMEGEGWRGKEHRLTMR